MRIASVVALALPATVVTLFLATLLFPTFEGDWPGVSTATSLSHVKQLATGTLIYQADFDDAWPVTRSGRTPTALGWGGRIAPYIKYRDAFTVYEDRKLRESEDGFPLSFGMNANTATAPKATALDHLEGTILLFEVTGARSSLDAGDASLRHPRLSPVGDGTPGGLRDTLRRNLATKCRYATGLLADPFDVGPRRLQGAVFAFADGHVRKFTRDQIREPARHWTFAMH